MPTIKPAKLKSGEWGINTYDVPELERGQMVRVHTRDSSYLVIVRNLVFMGEHDETHKKVAYYGIARLNDEDCCPTCGTQIDTKGADIIDHGKPNYRDRTEDSEEERPRSRPGQRKSPPRQRATRKAPQQEDFDDEIPF